MGHCLPHLELGERVVFTRAPGGIQRQIADAHGTFVGDRKLVHGGQFLGLIRGRLPDQVQRAVEQFGDLGVHIGDGTDIDLADLRLPLGAVVIVFILFQNEMLTRYHFGHLVGAGAHRLQAHPGGTSLGIVFIRIHRHRTRQELDGGRERLFQQDANGVIVDLLRRFHPVHIALGFDAIGLVGDEIDGKHNIVRVEGLTIVKRHTLAQLEFQSGVVDPRPVGRQIALVFVGRRIAIDQPVPDRTLQHDAFAGRVEIAVDVFQFLGEGGVERVIGLARPCRCGGADCGSGQPEFHIGHVIPLLAGIAETGVPFVLHYDIQHRHMIELIKLPLWASSYFTGRVAGIGRCLKICQMVRVG